MKKTVHLSLCIRGALNNMKNKKGHTKTYLQREDGTFSTVAEARIFLNQELKKGHDYLPMSDCDNFDYKKGCLGHEIKE